MDAIPCENCGGPCDPTDFIEVPVLGKSNMYFSICDPICEDQFYRGPVQT